MTNFKKCAKIFIESILRCNSSFIAAETIVFSPLFPLAIFREGKLFCPARFPFGRNGFLIARFPSRSMPPCSRGCCAEQFFRLAPFARGKVPARRGRCFPASVKPRCFSRSRAANRAGRRFAVSPAARERALFSHPCRQAKSGDAALCCGVPALCFFFFFVCGAAPLAPNRHRAPCANPAPRLARRNNLSARKARSGGGAVFVLLLRFIVAALCSVLFPHRTMAGARTAVAAATTLAVPPSPDAVADGKTNQRDRRCADQHGDDRPRRRQKKTCHTASPFLNCRERIALFDAPLKTIAKLSRSHRSFRQFS